MFQILFSSGLLILDITQHHPMHVADVIQKFTFSRHFPSKFLLSAKPLTIAQQKLICFACTKIYLIFSRISIL
jgi:hypothetical protein